MNYEYTSKLCEYCICTDFGLEPVNTGSWNLCEGTGCEEAFEYFCELYPNEVSRIEDFF